MSACLLCGARPGRPRSLPGAAGPVTACPACALAVRRSAERTDPDLETPLAPLLASSDNLAMSGRPRERRGRRPAIAERLRAARAARGIGQHAAAAELGITPSMLAEYESGSRRPSVLSTLALTAWSCASLRELSDLFPHVPKEP